MRVDHKTLQERFQHLPVKQEVAVYEFSFTVQKGRKSPSWKPKPETQWKLLHKIVLEGVEIP